MCNVAGAVRGCEGVAGQDAVHDLRAASAVPPPPLSSPYFLYFLALRPQSRPSLGRLSLLVGPKLVPIMGGRRVGRWDGVTVRMEC